ncbi:MULTISPECIES: DoxX family protein [unclassified Rhizobium]|uniref:DoxX family protein n=1 Tax=unclassified Rhizobium TaxID=2613769 RepID=UPI0038304571
MMERIDGKGDVWQRRCRWGLSAFYGLAGILHIVLPKPFLGITPAWVPEPETVIFLTGLCEIAGAVGLLMPRLRKAAGIGLALYAVCVFPANIKHAIDGLGAATVSPWQWLYHLVRLPLQLPLVWVALFAGSVVVWPFRRSEK